MSYSRLTGVVPAVVAACLFLQPVCAQDSFVSGGDPASLAQQAALREHVNRGNQFMSRHQYESAVAEYEAALKIAPTNKVVKYNMTELYNNWGSYLYRMRQFDGAEEKLKKCLKLNPNHRIARANLELLRKTLEAQGITMSMELDTEDRANPEAKNPEKKTEEPAKIVGASSAARTSSTPPVANKQTLFGAGGVLPESTTTFVSGSAVFPTYRDKPTATSAPMVPTINPNPVRPDLQTQSSAGSSSAASNSEAPRSGSVEEKLSELEKRFEGCTHTDWPVLKRLEQLELKVAGQAGTGRIDTRIEALQKL